MRKAFGFSLLVLLLASAAPVAPGAGAPDATSYVVGFEDMPDLARGEYGGGAIERVDDALRFAVVRAADGPAFESFAADDANVRYARLDDPAAYSVDWTPEDPQADGQYAWVRANATGAWDATRGSTSVVVAVVDSGVESTHEDLAGRVLPGYDFGSRDADPSDDCGHGTHVAGTVGATSGNGKGVAGTAQATMLPVKVLDARCRGSWSMIASGIRYAADQGARVITMSLGCGVSCYDESTADALDYAWGKGALLIAAAGNDGPCEGCISFPASHPRVLAVGCTDQRDARCSFGSAGARMVAAPGKDILSTTVDNSYGVKSGTSMSAPHVAGAAALALAANPSLTNAQLRALIERTAKDLGARGQDTQFGHGLVDMGALVAAANGGVVPPAPEPAPAPGRTPDPALPRGVGLSPAESASNVSLGGIARHTLLVENTGGDIERIQITRSTSASGWKTALSDASVILEPGEQRVVTLTVRAPRSATPGDSLNVTVKATTPDRVAQDVALTVTTVI